MPTNHDPETGIAYGVISAHELMQEALDDAEYDYGEPDDEAECPECGDITAWTDPREWGDTVACVHCGHEFELELPDFAEANAYTIESDGYLLQGECGCYASGSDIWVLRSPYFTIAEKCSPCAPGAGYLKPVQWRCERADTCKSTCRCRVAHEYEAACDITHLDCAGKCAPHVPANSMGQAERTYALDGDWFEDGIAPYPLWSVATGKRVHERRVNVPCAVCDGHGTLQASVLAERRGLSVPALLEQLEQPGQERLRGLLRMEPGKAWFECWHCNGTGKTIEVQRQEED